jgi:N-acetylmuramoyl-L-alanine amidase
MIKPNYELNIRNLTRKVIIHHSATINGDVYYLDNLHKEKGYSSVGYHYVIKKDGTLQIGRAEDTIGKHCFHHNADSIGICVIGIDNIYKEQFETLEALLTYLIEKYPRIRIFGHREVNETACPGESIQKWIDNFREADR